MVSVLGYELDVQTIILLVGTVSGWIAVVITYLSGRPRIKGRILNVMRGTFPNPENPSETLTSFVLFLYLTNTRKSSVHLLQYELSVDAGKGLQKMKSLTGITDDFNPDFEYGGRKLNIPQFAQRLLSRQAKPVVFGAPFTGFLIFAGDMKYYTADIRRYKLVLTDVFEHRHTVVANLKGFRPDRFESLDYIEDMFGLRGLVDGGATPPSQLAEPLAQTADDRTGIGQKRQSMARHEGETFVGKEVLLDGSEYIQCRFERCRILFGALGPVSLIGNSFSECEWEFTGAAAQTVAFLRVLYKGGGRKLVEKTLEDIRR